MSESKVCGCCGLELPLSDFHINRKGKFGRQAKCKKCTSDAYYARNREAVIERTRQRRATAEGREQERQWQRARRRSNPLVRMVQEAKARAAKRGIPFGITADHLEMPAVCPVLGIEISMGTGARANCSPSIDRIDSRNGYVPGNVQIISWRANRLKNDATLEEMKAIVSYMESSLGVAVTASAKRKQLEKEMKE